MRSVRHPTSVQPHVRVSLASLTGVLDYFFEYVLHPRVDSDIVPGSVCTLENTEALCSNTLDDDHDGKVDCLDSD